MDLDREEMVDILENKAGCQCYDHEDKRTLVEAIEANLADGTLTEDDMPDEDRDSVLYGRGLGPRPYTG